MSNWLNAGFKVDVPANTPVIINDANIVNSLVSFSLEGILFGEGLDYINSLIVYPVNIDMVKEATADWKDLYIGLRKISGFAQDIAGLTCKAVETNPYLDRGYGYCIASVQHTPKYNDFRDYEPYTSYSLYLPFFGYANLNVADIYNKYISVIMCCDWASGEAIYYVVVSDEQYTRGWIYQNNPNKTGTRIVGRHSFTLGVHRPMRSVGVTDTIRNTSLNALKGLTNVMGTVVGASVGSVSTSVMSSTMAQGATTTVKQSAGGRGGFLNRGRTVTTKEPTTRTSERTSTYHNNARIPEAMADGVETALRFTQPQIHGENACGSAVDRCGSLNVIMVRKEARIVEQPPEYNHYYGRPLGTVKTLGDISGYTEVANIHIEGVEFDTATKDEIEMVRSQLLSGVIL